MINDLLTVAVMFATGGSLLAGSLGMALLKIEEPRLVVSRSARLCPANDNYSRHAVMLVI